MKFKYILLIVLVIIALHLVVVWFFMRGGNVPAAGAEATAGGTEQSIAEAIAGGKVIIAIGVLLGLHDQQDQHTVVFAGAAQPPGVGGLHGVILRG